MLIIDKEQSRFFHPGIASSWAWCYGKARSNPLLLALLLIMSIVPWPLLLLKQFGFVGYLLTWVFLHMTRWSLLCIVRKRVLFKLLIIQSFMNALRILKLIVILRVIIFNMASSFSPSLPLLCSWRISSQSLTIKRFQFFLDKFSMLLAALFWVWWKMWENICIH